MNQICSLTEFYIEPEAEEVVLLLLLPNDGHNLKGLLAGFDSFSGYEGDNGPASFLYSFYSIFPVS